MNPRICTHCGRPIPPEANFCSACGAAAPPFLPPGQYPPQPSPRIIRPRYPRMIAGVCSGIALHYGWDLNLVRILTVIFTILTSGTGILLYIAGWILMPEAPYALPTPYPPTPPGNS